MILADENIDHSLIESIRQSGIEVYSIYELQRGTSDFSLNYRKSHPELF